MLFMLIALVFARFYGVSKNVIISEKSVDEFEKYVRFVNELERAGLQDIH